MNEDISSIRKEYTKAQLDETSVSKSPFNQFEKWFNEVLNSKLIEPTAMILSTVDQHHQPFQRTVLLKTFDTKGIVFYTNYKSRKGTHIANNKQVSVLFPWYELERQVMVTGNVEKISMKDSLAYFISRPKGSQLGAWVSNQSEIINSRSILEMKLTEMKEKFKDGQIPLPDHWGGYRISPKSFEFWQGRPSRLHDRIQYVMEKDEWKIQRLAP